MSVQAEVERSKRREWAATGGSHDRLVRVMQIGLPAAVGALVAILLFAPLGHRQEIGFLLAKDSIEVSPMRMQVQSARYSGSDSDGRPFSLTARRAEQRSAADPVVRMSDLSALLALPEGPATLDAETGRYDPTRDIVDVDGPVRFVAADGYRLDTADVAIDLKQRKLASARPVAGSLPIGQFSASRISADLEGRVVRLDGQARLRINQGAMR
jgi:lipopolysaccharide export system protein LptC